MDDSTLRRAILTADIGTLRAYLQGGGYPSAISYDEKRERHISLLELALDARDKREQMLEILLSAGANPYSPSVWVSNRSSTVIDLARDCGEIELADLIERLASQTGPSWHREAIQRRLDRIVIHYEKACGIQICPYDWPKPILYSDSNGARTTPAAACGSADNPAQADAADMKLTGPLVGTLWLYGICAGKRK